MGKVKLEPGPFVVPMPTVLVGAMVEGKPNFMTAAFVGIVNFKPTVIACGLNPDHHTCKGIEANGVFSIGLPHEGMVEATDWCGIWSGAKKDKSGVFETFTGENPLAPMVSACRLTAECKVIGTVKYEVDTVYLAEVTSAYADEAALTGGAPDWKAISPLIFTFPDKGYWKLGELAGKAWSVGKDYGK